MAKKESVIYKFSISKEQISILLDKIKDLVSIEDSVLMRIDNNYVVLYSMVGERQSIVAFKSFIIPTKQILALKAEIPTIKLIIASGKKLVRNLRSFLDYENNLDGEFWMEDDEFINNMFLTNSILDLNSLGGDNESFSFNFTIEQLKETMDKSTADFKFILNKSVFSQIKKMSQIELKNDIYFLRIKDKQLSIGEGTVWNLKIGIVNYEDMEVTLPKKYFNSLNFPDDKNDVEVYVFDSKILVDNDKTTLLVALELTV